jgi:hypothetical protein
MTYEENQEWLKTYPKVPEGRGITVAEFAEWLLTFPDQGAEIEVVEHRDRGGYECQGGVASEEGFDPSKHLEYTDFRGNQFVKPDSPHFCRRYLMLGGYRL